MSAFGLYVIGFIILAAGMIYGAHLLNIPQTWIIVGTLIVLAWGSCRPYPIPSGATRRPRRRETRRAKPLKSVQWTDLSVERRELERAAGNQLRSG